MKMYREMMRKLAPIGIPLALATLLYTLITNGQACLGAARLQTATSAIGLTPVLVYYAFSAVLFAFYGFSFLFKRSSSDLYHSMPISRLDLYLSVTLATVTWMGGTIVLNVLLTLGLYLVGGCPFVPVYIPMSILFYFIASMLIYAAAAIGCALSGTYFMALASTGIVLFLPRFIQFILARGLILQIPIIGWLDLSAWLDPSTNIATGLVVMQTRNVFIPQIINMHNILYSLIPMFVELVLAAWLFIRRPSETADHGTASKGWSLAVSVLLAFTVLMLLNLNKSPFTSMFDAALIAVALLVFVLCQFITLHSIKTVLKSLPYFLVSVALAVGGYFCINSMVNEALVYTPKPAEIASVSFRGHDTVQGGNEYTSLLLEKIHFTNDSLKKYVAENLSSAVDQIKADREKNYTYTDSNYSQYTVIEPVSITMQNGRTYRRTIEFSSMDTLNELRGENAEFQTAIHSLPPVSSIQYMRANNLFKKDELNQLWNAYTTEAATVNVVPNDYYLDHKTVISDYGFSVTRGDAQQAENIYVTGYIGNDRYSMQVPIRLETPKTVSLMMQMYNSYAKKGSLTKLQESVKHMLSPLVLESDSLSISMDCFNVKVDSGKPVYLNSNVYLSAYRNKDDQYSLKSNKFAQAASEILARGTPTDDCSGMFVGLSWSDYDSSNRLSTDYSTLYLSFTPEDEAALTTLFSNWQITSMNGY